MPTPNPFFGRSSASEHQRMFEAMFNMGANEGVFNDPRVKDPDKAAKEPSNVRIVSECFELSHGLTKCERCGNELTQALSVYNLRSKVFSGAWILCCTQCWRDEGVPYYDCVHFRRESSQTKLFTKKKP